MRELIGAVSDSRTWLGRFNRTEYKEAFREFADRYSPACLDALREQGPEAVSGSVLEGLGEAQRRERIWNRSALRFNQRQMLVVFVTPMLLELGEEGRRLAELLRDGWEQQRPGERYAIASFQELNDGFYDRILGIDLKRWRSP